MVRVTAKIVTKVKAVRVSKSATTLKVRIDSIQCMPEIACPKHTCGRSGILGRLLQAIDIVPQLVEKFYDSANLCGALSDPSRYRNWAGFAVMAAWPLGGKDVVLKTCCSVTIDKGRRRTSLWHRCESAGDDDTSNAAWKCL